MIAPIALFVYNRPFHTRRTVTALLNNKMAADSDLFIFSDGPKTDLDEEKVVEVRNYIKTITGFNKITIIERIKNIGLAQSIISGVTQVVDRFGTVIVLEDDLVTSPWFLQYMNDALEFYRDEMKVMHVSAGTYPVGDFCLQDTYFLRLPLCWGWGTWKRAWDKFDNRIEIMGRFNSRMISRFDFDDSYLFWEQLKLNCTGELETWFIFWYAHVFLSNALALFPRTSLVKNIGHDGSGIHCDKTDLYDVELGNEPIQISSIPLRESRIAFRQYKRYFRSLRRMDIVGASMRLAKKIIRIALRT